MDRAALLKSGAVGAVVGLACALGQALVVTLWELVENPGGIFRTAQGWRWDFLLETFASWFLPVAGPGALLGAAAALLIAWLRARGA